MGDFDRLNWQHSGEFDQIFHKNQIKSQMPRGLRGGGGMSGFGNDRCITNDKKKCNSQKQKQKRPYKNKYTKKFELVLFIFFFSTGVASQRILSKQLLGRYTWITTFLVSRVLVCQSAIKRAFPQVIYN